MSPKSELLEEMVRRIVGSVSPLRIILFGSAARGEMRPESDLDVLVVMPDGCDCLGIAMKLHRQLRGFQYAKDILVVPASDVTNHGNNPYRVIHTALTEGKELYHATSQSSARLCP
jgi:predicted nucleotidyltransferase